MTDSVMVDTTSHLTRLSTCTAPVNIAVIKYWGKRDDELILPLNASLSVTLHQNELRAKTTVGLSMDYTEDKIWINGKEESIDNPRIQKCLNEVRRIAQTLSKSDSERELYLKGRVHICSENNFPTAAGLASSAAGYACLVYCLAQVYGLGNVELSVIARQGSGSACRSIYGGFVAWEKGENKDGNDSIAVQIASESDWSDINVLVLVVSDQKKPISSTIGMKTSVHTSSLLHYRAESVVPQRMREMKEAILRKDFTTFGELTMKDSNQFHAVCLDTYPPILYYNDISKYIIQLITSYNAVSGTIKCAYSFDAGPNAVLFVPSVHVNEVVELVSYYLPPAKGDSKEFFRGLSSGKCALASLSKDIIDGISLLPLQEGALQYVIHTRVGPGPQVSNVDHLLDKNGLPILD